MTARDVLLFFIVCLIDGLCIFAGSVLGNSMGKTGVFAGAVAGGLLGVAIALMVAGRFKLIEPSAVRGAFIGGAMAFPMAALIAVRNLDGPVIPVLSVGLVGLGVLIGRRIAVSRQNG